ncbi:MAG: ABC transporter permease [Candidatus Brocadiia bacterium]
MQAIQSIEHATMQVSHRSSPFRALVWKEWRQQRWIFLSLAGLVYALLAGAAVVVSPDRSNYALYQTRDNAYGFLCICALLMGVIGVLVLSANAFAGERDDDTDLFLETIPCSRGKLFRVKLGFVLFLVLAALIPLGATALVHIGRQPIVDFHKLLTERGGTPFLELTAVVIVLAIVPALIASFGGSVIATILAAMPVIAACWAYVYATELFQSFSIGPKLLKDILAVLLPTLMIGTIFIAAWRMWVRAERTLRSSLRTASVAATLMAGYVAAPLAAAYIYVIFLAPLSFFLEGHGAVANVASLSPDGRYVTYNVFVHYTKWYMLRAALVDVDSGCAHWLDRYRNSSVRSLDCNWSPSGNQFVMIEVDVLSDEEAKLTYFVVNARSGEKHILDELCPSLSQIPSDTALLLGWYGDQLFAFQKAQDIFFADIERHELRQCKMPTAFSNASLENPFPLCVTRSGIFAVPKVVSPKGELRFLRYAPELLEAECLMLRDISGTPSRIDASNDGQWLLQQTIRQAGQQQGSWYLAPTVDRAKAILLVSENADEEGAIPSSWHVQGFLPVGHQILLYRDSEVGLFNADTHDLRRIPMPQASGRGIYGAMLSPAGGFALVGCVNTATVGKPGATSRYVVVDLHNGSSQAVDEASRAWYQNLRWLGEDHLLSENYGWMPVVINRDGTGARPLLE